MPDYKGMDKSQYSNDKYKKMIRGKSGKDMKVMKNHGNTSEIMTDAQKYDMGRLQKRGMEKRGYCDKAHDYKY